MPVSFNAMKLFLRKKGHRDNIYVGGGHEERFLIPAVRHGDNFFRWGEHLALPQVLVAVSYYFVRYSGWEQHYWEVTRECGGE